MAATTLKQKFGWGAGDTIVIAWALFPVWYIIAVSFQAPARLANWGNGRWRTTGASSRPRSSPVPS